MTAQTFSFAAPNAGQIIGAPDGTTFTADAFGLITGVAVLYIPPLLNAGCKMLGPGVATDADAWNAQDLHGSFAAAGATQGNATLLNKSLCVLNATTSAEGFILENVGIGAQWDLTAPSNVNTKLYPPSNGIIDNVTSTNEAAILTVKKGAIVTQISATKYQLAVKGA